MQLTKDQLLNTCEEQGHNNTKITLHWTAGHYDQLFDDYHLCIDGNGNFHQIKDFSEVGAHCYRENTNNFGISVCSNYNSGLYENSPGYFTYEPGPEPVNYNQLESLAHAVAVCCVTWGLPLSQVFTHGERCLIRQDLYDYETERWDLDILVPECHVRKTSPTTTSGGDWIRNRARELAKSWGTQL